MTEGRIGRSVAFKRVQLSQNVRAGRLGDAHDGRPKPRFVALGRRPVDEAADKTVLSIDLIKLMSDYDRLTSVQQVRTNQCAFS